MSKEDGEEGFKRKALTIFYEDTVSITKTYIYSFFFLSTKANAVVEKCYRFKMC